MNRRSKFAFLIICSLLLHGAQGADTPSAGFYSRRASPIWEKISGSPKPLELPAPDRQSSAVARYVEYGGDEKIVIDVIGRIGRLQVDLGPGVASELLWAPDSNAFFVTTSDQGANGSYRLLVVGNFDGTLKMRDLTSLIVKTFGHPVRCEALEDPNVAGITWIHGSDRLMAAAEIVNHSVCDSAGTFKAYEVDLTHMKILRTFGQIQTKAQFRRELGKELMNAEDECVIHPRSCHVSTNHPEHNEKSR